MIQKYRLMLGELTDDQPAAPFILLTAASVFFHFVLVFICAAVCTVYLFARAARKKDFKRRAFIAASFFSLFVISTALISGNFIGAAAGTAIGCVLLTGILFRKTMNPRLFEAALDTLCAVSFFAAAVALIQKCIPLHEFMTNRPESTFVNTNYYAAALALVILVAVYKLLFNHGGRRFYITVLILNTVMMYLTLCRSSWAPMGVGILILLLFARRYKLFAAFLAFALIVTYFAVGQHMLLPRMANLQTSAYGVRKEMWDGALNLIAKRPFTGFGPMGYMFAAGGTAAPMEEWHAHNLLLEMLVSYGIVGSVLLIYYFGSGFKALLKSAKPLGTKRYFGLAVAAMAAVIVHGITDCTVLWIQTAVFLVLLMSGVKNEERAS